MFDEASGTMLSAEQLFARALNIIEPEKKEEGSIERQKWLGLIMDIQQFLVEGDFDNDSFLRELGVLAPIEAP